MEEGQARYGYDIPFDYSDDEDEDEDDQDQDNSSVTNGSDGIIWSDDLDVETTHAFPPTAGSIALGWLKTLFPVSTRPVPDMDDTPDEDEDEDDSSIVGLKYAPDNDDYLSDDDSLDYGLDDDEREDDDDSSPPSDDIVWSDDLNVEVTYAFTAAATSRGGMACSWLKKLLQSAIVLVLMRTGLTFVTAGLMAPKQNCPVHFWLYPSATAVGPQGASGQTRGRESAPSMTGNPYAEVPSWSGDGNGLVRLANVLPSSEAAMKGLDTVSLPRISVLVRERRRKGRRMISVHVRERRRMRRRNKDAAAGGSVSSDENYHFLIETSFDKFGGCWWEGIFNVGGSALVAPVSTAGARRSDVQDRFLPQLAVKEGGKHALPPSSFNSSATMVSFDLPPKDPSLVSIIFDHEPPVRNEKALISLLVTAAVHGAVADGVALERQLSSYDPEAVCRFSLACQVRLFLVKFVAAVLFALGMAPILLLWFVERVFTKFVPLALFALGMAPVLLLWFFERVFMWLPYYMLGLTAWMWNPITRTYNVEQTIDLLLVVTSLTSREAVFDPVPSSSVLAIARFGPVVTHVRWQLPPDPFITRFQSLVSPILSMTTLYFVIMIWLPWLFGRMRRGTRYSICCIRRIWLLVDLIPHPVSSSALATGRFGPAPTFVPWQLPPDPFIARFQSLVSPNLSMTTLYFVIMIWLPWLFGRMRRGTRYSICCIRRIWLLVDLIPHPVSSSALATGRFGPAPTFVPWQLPPDPFIARFQSLVSRSYY